MSLLNNEQSNKDLEKEISNLDNNDVTFEGASEEDAIASKQQEKVADDNSSKSLSEDANIVDIDAELSKEKAKAGIKDIDNKEALSPDEEKPMQPGVGKVSDLKNRSGMAKAPKPEKPLTSKPEAPQSQGLGAFSLLPLDEEAILYEDLPRAIRKLLYMLFAIAFVILGAWYFSTNFLTGYMQEANTLQSEIRTVNAEKLKYQVTDADLRVNYQYYQLVKNLLYNHITWQKFFLFLETFTVPEVYYTNFSVNAVIDDNITFDVMAWDLESALKQYLVLQKYTQDYTEMVEWRDLQLVSNDEGDQQVRFSLSFKLKDKVFRLKEQKE